MPRQGIYLLTGADRPRKLERLHQLAKELGIQPVDRHRLDGAAVTAGALLSCCRQLPFASPARLIVVDQAHRLDGACVEALLGAAELIRTCACVVLLAEAELDGRHPLGRAGAALMVEDFSGRQAQAARPFALIDAIGARDAAGALHVIQEQLALGKDPLEVVALVGWQAQRWVAVRRMQGLGYDADRIAQICGLKPWQVSRIQSEVAGRPLGSLTRILERCWQVDVELKTGRAVGILGVERLVLEMCGVA